MEGDKVKRVSGWPGVRCGIIIFSHLPIRTSSFSLSHRVMPLRLAKASSAAPCDRAISSSGEDGLVGAIKGALGFFPADRFEGSFLKPSELSEVTRPWAIFWERFEEKNPYLTRGKRSEKGYY